MAKQKPSAIRARDLEPRMSSVYPPEFAKAVAGREKRAVGDHFGLDQYGVNQVTLPPGVASSQRHWHAREDEFIYVLDGEITLVDDTGEHKLTPGMCAGFKAGVANGHCLINRSKTDAIYLEVGSRYADEEAYYSDVDLKGVKRAGKFVFTRKDGSTF